MTARSAYLNMLRDQCYSQACKAGWHDKPREKGTLIALMHSELSEALEGERRDSMDDHLPHRRNAEVELADLLIRVLDYCGLHNYDIGGAVCEKMAYNATRPDHLPGYREAPGGKQF